MRCLFCKADSSRSRSVEHIIPESLGNSRHILGRGVVCDGCNNYFAKGVEKPFLESPGVKTLRFEQELLSKKGRVPTISGLLSPGVPVEVTRFPKLELTSVAVPPDAFERVIAQKSGQLLIPTAGPWPTGSVLSRFMAKIALESMAARLETSEGGLDYLCGEAQLDPLRDHARRGTTPIWPVHVRQLYPSDGYIVDASGDRQQIVHESDFLVTAAGEWYFVLALFGTEFAINLSGPDIDGYRRWVLEKPGESVLYSLKNLALHPMPTSA
ncbi:HNH endonuclease [Brevundimonas albigilva]|uniref:HNH endonuclease n=1 Tax=Brevundimonas albigilva TaxID=1312364 RepID=UPI0024BFCA61|nr:HNH endonuclease [Brevundimonas albigilva]